MHRLPTSPRLHKPMLAGSYGPGIDPSGWILSEKLDGVRAIWTGSELVTRTGKPIAAPSSLRDLLPAGIALDGELWMGRGRFQDVAGIVRTLAADEALWAPVRFAVFDTPGIPGAVHKRLGVAVQAVGAAALALAGDPPPDRIFTLEQVPCTGRRDLEQRLRAVEKSGGEGLMLRHPDSFYVGGRSSSLLKLKRGQSDEGRVIGHEGGRGRLEGLLGTLLLRWRGRIIKLGTGIPCSLRISPPPLGALVSFSFEGLTASGLPRSASFLTLRNYE